MSRMRIRLQLLANQNWRSNGCYQSLACAPGSGYENDEFSDTGAVRIATSFCKLCLTEKQSHSSQPREIPSRRSLELLKMPFEIRHFVETNFYLRKGRSTHSISIISVGFTHHSCFCLFSRDIK